MLGAGFGLLALIVALWAAPATATEQAVSLNLDQRVECATTLKDLDWAYTLWPKENPAPKPARNSVLGDAAIRAQVEARLRMESALLALYNVRLDAAALQTEMNRMALGTQAPERLREIFAALNDDPSMVAECLARPALAERRLRAAYAHNARWHGELQARAQAWLAGKQTAAALQQSGGREDRVVYVLRAPDEKEASESLSAAAGEIALSAEEFARERACLLQPGSSAIGTPGLDTLPTHGEASLRETESAFIEETVLSASAGRIEVRSRVWAKLGFDAWWQARAAFTPMAPLQSPKGLRLPEISGHATDLGKAAADSWRREQFVFEGRSGHTAVWTGSEMIAWGGIGASDFLASGVRYNPMSDRSTATQVSGAPAKRSHHTAVWTGSEMIVWGGSGSLATGGRYSPATDSWTATATSGAPAPRDHHTAVWAGSEMIVWGGYGGGTALASGGRYNPACDCWTATATNTAPAARIAHTAVWTGSEMIVWGGYDGAAVVASGGRYNPVSDRWTATPASGAPTARSDHTAVWTGSEMIVWGGYDLAAVVASGSRYNPVSDSWTAMPANGAPAARLNHTSVWTGREMIVWGGRYPSTSAGGSGYLASGGRYDPASDRWTATQVNGAPTARAAHTAVWTGSEMIVWGGGALGSPYFDNGSRYNPASDSWTATQASGAPTTRAGHTMLWTGSEMIVWGGRDGPDVAATGGRYDPVSDNWTRTSVTAAPDARFLHSAVWTGSEMIVWGGYDGSAAMASGGRYQPASDSWMATPASGSPAARLGHTAVWTGSEMIVWGGYNGLGAAGFLATGGRYRPTSNNWTATPISAAPSGRTSHTAVWTGSEMIIWGGAADSGSSSGTLYFATGARYNPVTDVWTATPSSAAPTPRGYHTAVWTGSEMIVWGGQTAGFRSAIPLATGGRYNPANDRWTATSDSGAPQARVGHTAVWTGSEMIVWGALGSMGVYYPATVADEPVITRYALPAPNPPDANCPAGFFIVLVGDGPGAGISNGVFGTEVLLDEPGTRILAGGLNFGGLFDVSQPGFAGVNIANAGNEPQRLNLSLKGNPATSADGSIPVRVRVALRTVSSSTAVFEATVDINQATAFESGVNVPPGFYEVTVTPLAGTPFGDADGLFSLSLATRFVDRAGGGFQGGAVVGGYHSTHPFQGAAGYSGFAAFCLATAHSTSIRILSRPSYGTAGARDLRLRIWDAQLRELIVEPN